MFNGNRFRNMRGDLNWYKEDLFFEDYPLSKEEENNLFQHFKKEKAAGRIPRSAEYHDWKVTVGYPKQWANYLTGDLAYYRKPSKWEYNKKLFTSYYKEEYLKEWKGEDIAPVDKEK